METHDQIHTTVRGDNDIIFSCMLHFGHALPHSEVCLSILNLMQPLSLIEAVDILLALQPTGARFGSIQEAMCTGDSRIGGEHGYGRDLELTGPFLPGPHCSLVRY